jgi:hypothetical protein
MASKWCRQEVERVESRKGDWSLAGMLDEVAAGRFPLADGGVTIIPPPSQRDAGVLGFTAHAVIFIDADPAWVTGQLPEGTWQAR